VKLVTSNALLLTAVLFMSGCSALKAKTGQYVTEAVVADIVKRVDKKLEERGLSRSEIKQVVDTNKDGKLDKSEIMATAKGAVKDLVALKVAEREAHYKEKFASADSLWGTIGSLVGLVVLYLIQQIFSAKGQGNNHARLMLLEKALQKDLDQDGVVGDVEVEGGDSS